MEVGEPLHPVRNLGTQGLGGLPKPVELVGQGVGVKPTRTGQAP